MTDTDELTLSLTLVAPDAVQMHTVTIGLDAPTLIVTMEAGPDGAPVLHVTAGGEREDGETEASYVEALAELLELAAEGVRTAATRLTNDV